MGLKRTSTGSESKMVRRPTGYWTNFNLWWRERLEKLGKRPSAGEITRWYEAHSEQEWVPSEKPSLKETRSHAKCLRSTEQVRNYFRRYRAIRKDATGERKSPARQEHDEGSWDEQHSPSPADSQDLQQSDDEMLDCSDSGFGQRAYVQATHPEQQSWIGQPSTSRSPGIMHDSRALASPAAHAATASDSDISGSTYTGCPPKPIRAMSLDHSTLGPRQWSNIYPPPQLPAVGQSSHQTPANARGASPLKRSNSTSSAYSSRNQISTYLRSPSSASASFQGTPTKSERLEEQTAKPSNGPASSLVQQAAAPRLRFAHSDSQLPDFPVQQGNAFGPGSHVFGSSRRPPMHPSAPRPTSSQPGQTLSSSSAQHSASSVARSAISIGALASHFQTAPQSHRLSRSSNLGGVPQPPHPSCIASPDPRGTVMQYHAALDIGVAHSLAAEDPWPEPLSPASLVDLQDLLGLSPTADMPARSAKSQSQIDQHSAPLPQFGSYPPGRALTSPAPKGGSMRRMQYHPYPYRPQGPWYDAAQQSYTWDRQQQQQPAWSDHPDHQCYDPPDCGCEAHPEGRPFNMPGQAYIGDQPYQRHSSEGNWGARGDAVGHEEHLQQHTARADDGQTSVFQQPDAQAWCYGSNERTAAALPYIRRASESSLPHHHQLLCHEENQSHGGPALSIAAAHAMLAMPGDVVDADDMTDDLQDFLRHAFASPKSATPAKQPVNMFSSRQASMDFMDCSKLGNGVADAGDMHAHCDISATLRVTGMPATHKLTISMEPALDGSHHDML